MERIIAAVDGSTSSLKAVAVAADLAGKYGAELILLTVTPELSASSLTAELATYIRQEQIDVPVGELATVSAENILAGARLHAQANGAGRISTCFSSGDPAEEIIFQAKGRHANLIVVGSRGHGQLAGLLLGSVAQKIVVHAPCPVLVVR
jgi:nucleotide-binding universal stress UspA family protein